MIYAHSTGRVDTDSHPHSWWQEFQEDTADRTYNNMTNVMFWKK